jgi:hypothetical protein
VKPNDENGSEVEIGGVTREPEEEAEECPDPSRQVLAVEIEMACQERIGALPT